MSLIKVVQLRKEFGKILAIDNVSLTIESGESLGLVGESGSGKSTLARIILGLIEPSSGESYFQEKAFSKIRNSRLEIRNWRRNCQIVFQDPQTSLNPRMRVGKAIGEPLLIHKIFPKEAILKRTAELLEMVKLLADYAGRFPHELSGGERQRVGIARALAVSPKFLILDEPVSALDLSTQVEILKLLKELKRKFNLTYLFIAHDLAVIGYLCDRIAVMHDGKIVEVGSRDEILQNPQEPYTQRLLASSL